MIIYNIITNIIEMDKYLDIGDYIFFDNFLDIVGKCILDIGIIFKC
jgi:hypothetical protein